MARSRAKASKMRQSIITSSLAIAVLACTPAAKADIIFCNHFKVQIWVAIAYQQSDGNWLSRGWINPNPNQCLSFDTALHVRTFYYRAISMPYYQNGHTFKMAWGKGKYFAVWDSDNFEYWNAQNRVLNSTLEAFSAAPVATGKGDVWIKNGTVTFGPGVNTTTTISSN
jgi:phage-related tail fiber protein